MKVMIVDDSREMRELIRTLLADVASEFVECANGEQAVASYCTERPDWAVMDVAMGVMDGITAAKLITSHFPDSRIIIVTQHNHPKLRERAMEVGARGFLPKEDLVDLKLLFSTAAGEDGTHERAVPSASMEKSSTTETSHEL